MKSTCRSPNSFTRLVIEEDFACPCSLISSSSDTNSKLRDSCKSRISLTLSTEYYQNEGSYITSDEVEVELREDAIDKAIEMHKKGMSKKAIDQVIMDMEDSIEEDAEVIINILDKDGDELVEPEELT